MGDTGFALRVPARIAALYGFTTAIVAIVVLYVRAMIRHRPMDRADILSGVLIGLLMVLIVVGVEFLLLRRRAGTAEPDAGVESRSGAADDGGPGAPGD